MTGGVTTIPVLVIVPPRTLLLDVAGPIEALRKANLVQDRVRFTVSYHGPRSQVVTSIGLSLTGIEPLPARLPAGAMVVITGSADEPLRAGHDLADEAADPVATSVDAETGRDPGHEDDGYEDGRLADDACDDEIVRWLRRAIRPGITLVTICSGALLAARAGLFDGHECTTHYLTIEALRASAPAARVRDNRLFVEDHERLSSAGVTAGIDLMLAIVARHAGHATALAVARYLVIYLRRTGADPQLSPWLEGRNHLHPAIHRAQDAIVADPARPWSVDTLAAVAATSPRHLSRLFNAHVGMSVTDYVNRIRVALARELVGGPRLGMERIAERAGFGSARQLRRAWARWQPATPLRPKASGG